MNNVSERTEMLLPEPARALSALLDVRQPDLEHGAGLPLLWHWVYLLDRPAQADLGPDGHPLRGTTAAFQDLAAAGCGPAAASAPMGRSGAGNPPPNAATCFPSRKNRAALVR